MKITYSTTTKLRLLSQFQNVNESLKVFADYHNVSAGRLKRWIQQYLTGGLANLERPVHNRRYPKKLKLRAVRDYRNHRLPTKEILLKYDIRGLSQLRNWVILYNNGKEPVRKRVRKMGRKVSYDEKIEIVKWV
ncbi:transposase, partial [Limosilactobacillus fermentum]|uniref:transposase n=1 Tax=Limosilactobacillus fermentum TaxID=1613 RepID=UPI000B350BDF